MPTRSSRTRIDDQRRDHIDPVGPPQENCPKQIQNHNLPINEEENIYSKNKGRDLQLANKPRIVLWIIKRMLQMIQRHKRVILHRSAHPQRKQDQTEKSSYGLDWPQKGIWYDSAKLDNKLPQNVQNINRSHKLYRENHGNLESRLDNKRKKLSWSKDPKKYISMRCTVTVTIHNCDDAT